MACRDDLDQHEREMMYLNRVKVAIFAVLFGLFIVGAFGIWTGVK